MEQVLYPRVVVAPWFLLVITTIRVTPPLPEGFIPFQEAMDSTLPHLDRIQRVLILGAGLASQ